MRHDFCILVFRAFDSDDSFRVANNLLGSEPGFKQNMADISNASALVDFATSVIVACFAPSNVTENVRLTCDEIKYDRSTEQDGT